MHVIHNLTNRMKMGAVLAILKSGMKWTPSCLRAMTQQPTVGLSMECIHTLLGSKTKVHRVYFDSYTMANS